MGIRVPSIFSWSKKSNASCMVTVEPPAVSCIQPIGVPGGAVLINLSSPPVVLVVGEVLDGVMAGLVVVAGAVVVGAEVAGLVVAVAGAVVVGAVVVGVVAAG